MDAERQRLASLRARLALAGWTLTESQAGVYLAARWNRTHELPDLDAIEAFASRVGAA